MAEKLFGTSSSTKEEVFVYLDGLRESGVTNMFGARPFIEGSIGVDSTTAASLLTEWMQTYGKRHPA